MADFDQAADRFVAYYDRVRGHIREVLTRRNLEKYLPKVPATVIDIGGGDGRDDLWLAQQGYQVDLVDPSELMIKKAQSRFRAASLSVKVHHLNPESVLTQFKSIYFDIVLSHGVLMYCVDDPEAHITTLSQLTAPGGVVSILTKGYGGGLMRALQQHDDKNLRSLIARQECTNSLGLPVRAFKPGQVITMLNHYGFKILTWYGVRIASDEDSRPISELDPEELKRILQVEDKFGKDPATKGLGQMLHYLAVKV